MQILHAGRYAYSKHCLAPSAILEPIGALIPNVLNEEGIKKQITAAARAAEADCEGVEVMGSEEYFLNQFLAPRTNRREDRWGGSLGNRMRLPVEVVRRVCAPTGS